MARSRLEPMVAEKLSVEEVGRMLDARRTRVEGRGA